MIGFVIVSHSAALAAGVRELARQIVRDQVPIAVAGGLADPEDALGTDPFRVLAAIEAVYSDEGVVVFMDLGSAILSAETALDFLPAEQRAHVHLCPAPLVEGVIAAAVQALSGAPVAAVLAEANSALQAKLRQLSPTGAATAPLSLPNPLPTDALSTVQMRQVRVASPLGLHTRPAARMVNALRGVDAVVTIATHEQTANARSINQLLSLMAQQGDQVTIQAEGPQAEAALNALEALVAGAEGEPTRELVRAHAEDGVVINTPADAQGIGIVAGVAVGPAFVYRPRLTSFHERTVADPQAEWLRFQQAVGEVRAALQALQQINEQRLGEQEAAIFAAQAAILSDPDLEQVVHDLIVGQRLNAEAAWQRVTNALAQRFTNTDQAYWRQRAADLQDVQAQVVRRLLGEVSDLPELIQPSILIAADVSPTVLARLPADQVLGLILEQGGSASHTAILARALGIPTIMGISSLLDGVRTGQVIALDGATGRVWLRPNRTVQARLTRLRTQGRRAAVSERATAHLPAILQDGKVVGVAANINSVPEAIEAVASGADGVGLFRTEFLYVGRATPPDEAEQLAAYTGAAQALAGRPLVIRTLDLGGDKIPSYLGWPVEANPALGWRGIRYWLARPEIARPQLRAILRAGAHHPVKLLLPFVTCLDEIEQTQGIIAALQAELGQAGLPYAVKPALGVMIETPAAVLLAPQLAAQVDFFSIGTNDLTQFVMAADRNNLQVAALADGRQPAVLRMIQQTVQAAHQAGVRVTVCGELAADPHVAILLVGLGVDELSMHVPAIPTVKTMLRRTTLVQSIALAEASLALASAGEVATYLRRSLAGHG